MTKTVLISGASVAGTTLAYWLHRHGFTPTVVERAEALREGGYKIDIRGAALDVVERMGVLDAVRAVPTEVRGGTIVTAEGKQVASMDGDTFGGRQRHDAEILRGDLTRILHDETSDSVEYLWGESIATMSETAEGIDVTFTGGATRTFNLVIGADGLHSHTRALAFGPEEKFVHDLGHHVAIFSVPNDLGLDRWEMTYVAPRRTALTYATARDTGAKAMFLFAADGPAPDRRDRATQVKALTDAYAQEGWEVPRLLVSAESAPDFYFDTLSQVRMDRWSTGRVALVGDAAYCASPASGQGTSLALVGAYVLAGELAAAFAGRSSSMRSERGLGSTGTNGSADHVRAFAAYEERMRPFVDANQKLGPANVKRMVLASKGQVRISMFMLGILNRLPGKEKIMAKAIEPIHRAATAISLPTY